MIGTSRISKDENLPYEGLVFKLSKQVSKDPHDMLHHILRYRSQEDSYLNKQLAFETYYFDDLIKVDVFHKNSPNKVNCIGKGKIDLREIEFDSMPHGSIIGVPVKNKKLGKIIGYLYLKVSYNGRDSKLFDMNQLFGI